MASEAILKQKQGVIDEIKDRVQSAKTIVLNANDAKKSHANNLYFLFFFILFSSLPDI